MIAICHSRDGQKLTDLHATTQTKNEVQSRLLLDVVVGKGAAVLELLAGENQALLIRRNAFLILNLGLDVVDGIAGLDLQSDGLAGDWKRKSQLNAQMGIKCRQDVVAVLTKRQREEYSRVLTKICMMTSIW